MLKNKIAVVTGAGGGIGKAVALLLLEKGAKIIAVDISREDLDKLAKEVGGEKISTYVVDISNKDQVEKLSKEVGGKFGGVDILINNAGIIQPFVRINDLKYEDIDRVMNVNFYGTLYMTKSFLPYLLKSNEAHITNVSSMGGFLPVPGQSVYGASKAAVKLMTEGLAAELMNTKVGVSVVFPGATNTNISKNSGVIMDEETEKEAKKQDYPTLPPEKVAELIVSGIEKKKLYICTGKDSKMMNLLYRFFPYFALKMITKQMGSLLND